MKMRRDVERWSLESGELMHTYRIETPRPARLPAAPLPDSPNFTPHCLWEGPGGPFICGTEMGSHTSPAFDLSQGARFTVIPFAYDQNILSSDGAVLFDLHAQPPCAVALLHFKGEFVESKFTNDSVLMVNTKGEIYHNRLPANLQIANAK